MAEEIIVGIDLGTTFSAISFINKHGKPEIIANREGDRTTPSVIFFDEDGGSIIGKEARNMAISNPHRTVRFVKREMGNPSFRFNVDGKDYFPEDLSAMILKKLKNDAEAYLDREIDQAVISVPAYFKDAQREATRQAAEIAGLKVTRIINEPTAAALAYGLEKSEDDQKILVYDFGGGTFDVTLMDIKGKEFTIVATVGNAKLGGKDIDSRLVEYFAEEFQREYEIDLRTESHTHQDIWDKAEIAKKDLSFWTNLMVTLASGDKFLRLDIDRDQFNGLLEDIIKETEDCMVRVLKDAGFDWSQIDTILLAGGSSRIPAVQEMIRQVTGKDVARDMNPDECVAMGAAIQAAVAVSEREGEVMIPELKEVADIVIKDVTAHSLGVKALSSVSSDHRKYVNSIIIPCNTKVPCQRKKIYTTAQDNQSQILIEVLQGEDEDPRSPKLELIGKAGLKDLPSHIAGDLTIEITLSYDVDGVIEVIAQELQSGKRTREVVMQKAATLSDGIVQEKKEKLDKEDL